MMHMYYPSIKEDYLRYYAKHDTCNLLNAYIDAHRLMLIDKYLGYGVHAITILK